MDNEENEVIDLTEILSAVRQHLLELIFVTLAAALVGFTASKFLMTPKYDSSALMIVNTRQDVNANVTSDQINSATQLVSGSDDKTLCLYDIPTNMVVNTYQGHTVRMCGLSNN